MSLMQNTSSLCPSAEPSHIVDANNMSLCPSAKPSHVVDANTTSLCPSAEPSHVVDANQSNIQTTPTITSPPYTTYVLKGLIVTSFAIILAILFPNLILQWWFTKVKTLFCRDAAESQ